MNLAAGVHGTRPHREESTFQGKLIGDYCHMAGKSAYRKSGLIRLRHGNRLAWSSARQMAQTNCQVGTKRYARDVVGRLRDFDGLALNGLHSPRWPGAIHANF